MSYIELNQVYKQYQGEAMPVTALDYVSLCVEKGDFLAVTGPSGSGKSTLMHIIGGVDYVDSGSVIVDGCDITSLDEQELSLYRRRKTGLIYQFYNLIPTLTAEENIILPLLLDKLPPDKTRLQQVCSMLGIEDRLHHLPSQLSGGQQQRVAIGRAIIHRPALLLADEPTGNLDQDSGHEILSALQEANQKLGQTVILITHDAMIAKAAKRQIALVDGKIAVPQKWLKENE